VARPGHEDRLVLLDGYPVGLVVHAAEHQRVRVGGDGGVDHDLGGREDDGRPVADPRRGVVLGDGPDGDDDRAVPRRVRHRGRLVTAYGGPAGGERDARGQRHGAVVGSLDPEAGADAAEADDPAQVVPRGGGHGLGVVEVGGGHPQSVDEAGAGRSGHDVPAFL
jgi:hypothetical protein